MLTDRTPAIKAKDRFCKEPMEGWREHAADCLGLGDRAYGGGGQALAGSASATNDAVTVAVTATNTVAIQPNGSGFQVLVCGEGTPVETSISANEGWTLLQPTGAVVLTAQTTSTPYRARRDDVSEEVIEGTIERSVLKVELEFQSSKMSRGKIIAPYAPTADVRIGVVVGDTITFKAKLTPAITLVNSDYVWSGAQSGNGPIIAITFSNACNYAEGLSVLGYPNRIAAITAMEVPPPNQGTWAVLHPPSALTASDLADEALAWAQANETALGGGLHNGRADAARHSYWNVLMSVEMDTATAEGAGTAHERTNIENGDSHNESVMDLHNNAVGRSISSGLTTNRTDCQNAAINALNGGTLWILDDLTNANEVGLLKPSNQ